MLAFWASFLVLMYQERLIQHRKSFQSETITYFSPGSGSFSIVHNHALIFGSKLRYVLCAVCHNLTAAV